MVRRGFLWIVLCVGVCRVASGADALLDRIGVRRGVCVVLGDPQCAQAIELARASELTLYVPVGGMAELQAAAGAAEDAKLLGSRVFVDAPKGRPIGLADNVADAVVGPAGAPRAEVMRVLRPGGRAVLGGTIVTKPRPQGVDDWSHHYHGPDNNPQSLDRLARAPYLTQFVAEPRYAPAPQNAVSANGRFFMAFGHVAWHQREEPMLDTLVAVNGYNGSLLWTRKLTSGIMVDRSTMIATDDTLYLADEASCKRLDARTGEVKGEIVAPTDLTGGTFWKWMALADGRLYALVGKDEGRDPVKRWRRTQHGWPWGGISDGYNKGEYRWGLADTLVALEPETGKLLWHHKEAEPIDSRSLCTRDGRIYLANFGRYLVCLDGKTGTQRWRQGPDLFKAIGAYRPGHGYIGGWKSTTYVKCTDRAVYFIGPQVNWLTALAAEDGRVLWKHPAKDLHVVIRDDGLYVIGPQKSKNQTQRLDPLTGKVLATYDTHRRACTRSTGTADGILFRASGGSGRLDAKTGKMQWISAMRPSCHVGVVIANGHLYWMPWVCDCNLQMFGTIALGPAGTHEFAAEASPAERLERLVSDEPKPLPVAENDWPMSRANAARTGRTGAAVPATVAPLWQAAVSCKLTSPVAAGGLVFVGGSDGAVRAFDAEGKARWTTYTGGAIPYPPTIADGRAYVGSGDGWMSALEAATGRVLWRFRAAPAERRILFYGRLTSTWPVASGVLVHDGVAYFAAGINDYDGTHVYALDAATGAVRWQNSTCGHLDEFSRRGVACQGEMLLHQGRLYLAGGNAVSPGIFDLATGKCLNAPPKDMGTRARRGRELVLAGNQVQVTGQALYSPPEAPVFDGSVQWKPDAVQAQNAQVTCRKGQGGWALVAHQGDRVLWQQPLPGAPVRWGVAIDAKGRIVAVTRKGQVVCFGPQ
jgi:outer membrane protein assembly factor BamB